MDTAKAGVGAVAFADPDDASHRKHIYEQVFSTFTSPEKSNFVQAQPPNYEANPPPASDDMRQSQQKNKSPLFWVNSDPQTVKRGSKEETLKRIRSHVMSEHNRKKRLENTRRYNKSKTWKNLAFRPEPAPSSKLFRAITASVASPSPTSRSKSASASASASDESSSSPETVAYSLKGKVAKPKPKRAAPLSSNTASVDTSVVKNTQDLQFDRVAVAQRQDSVKLLPPHGRIGPVDPFLTMQVQLSDSQYQHFKYFLYDLIPQAAPFMHHGVANLRRHWVALAQSSPSTLHACITSGATNKALISGHLFADPDTQRTSPLIFDRLCNRGETISLVNRDLSSVTTASSDAVIAAVSVLISIEIAGGDSQDYAVHLHGLLKMVSLRKKFSDIAKNVRWQIEWTDVRSACKSMSKPLFPFIRYTMPTHIPPEVMVENAGRLGSSLRAMSRIPGLFGASICRSIDDLTSLTLYAEIFKTQPKRATVLFDEDIEEYFNNEVLYTEYCLLNDRWTLDGTCLVGDDTPEGALRLACLLFHNTAIWPFYPSIAPLFPMPLLMLESSLRNGLAAGYYDNASPATPTTALLIWISFTGACAAKYLPPFRAFFVAELAAAITRYNYYHEQYYYYNSSSPPLSPPPSLASPTSSTSTATSLSTSTSTSATAFSLPLSSSLSSSSFSSSSSSSPSFPPAPPKIKSFEDLHTLLSGFLYVDRCYLADAQELYASISAMW